MKALNTYAITRAMIESAVAHGLKEIEEDPKRSARRLVDLGMPAEKMHTVMMLTGTMRKNGWSMIPNC